MDQPEADNLSKDKVPGGLGGVSGIRDTRLIERAVRQRWPISDDLRRLLVGKMAQTMAKSDSERNRIAAARVIVSIDQINLQAEQGQTPATNELDEPAISDADEAACLETLAGAEESGGIRGGGEPGKMDSGEALPIPE